MSLNITIDYNNGQPIAEMAYKGKTFGKSPFAGALPAKPKSDDEKVIATWKLNVKKKINSLIQTKFRKSVYKNIVVAVNNIE